MNQSVVQKNDKLYVNGIEIEYPKQSNSHTVCQINNRIFADGYEFVNGKWKRTIEAIFHLVF